MTKKQELEISHYSAGIRAIETLCTHELAKTNPSACIDAILAFIRNLEYNNPAKE